MEKFYGIQALRFIAAALVVVAHATQAVSIRLQGGDGQSYWELGTFGVDIFFVISGFIMATTTNRMPGGWVFALEFMRRRLIRIVPMYWIYTSLKLLAVGLVAGSSTKPFPTIDHIVASYFLVPYPDASGELWPVLPVGWTLTFELTFYIAFALAIATTRWRAMFTGAVLAVIAALALLVPAGRGGDSLLTLFCWNLCTVC